MASTSSSLPPKKRKFPKQPSPPSSGPHVFRSTDRVVTRSSHLSSERVTRSRAQQAAASGHPLLFFSTGWPTRKRSEKTKPKGSRPSATSSSNSNSRNNTTTIVIEFSTQSVLFRTRALAVREGLQAQVRGITFKLNPQKPRRGCFEIRNEKGEKFISLLNLKDPYDQMMELNIREVVSDISNKITGRQ